MDQQRFTSEQKSVLSVLTDQDLTSSQILKKAENISNILKLYSVLDELRTVNIVNSYIEKETRYHHIV